MLFQAGSPISHLCCFECGSTPPDNPRALPSALFRWFCSPPGILSLYKCILQATSTPHMNFSSFPPSLPSFPSFPPSSLSLSFSPSFLLFLFLFLSLLQYLLLFTFTAVCVTLHYSLFHLYPKRLSLYLHFSLQKAASFVFPKIHFSISMDV